MPPKPAKLRDAALRRAVRRRCAELFAQRWGREWDDHDRARFKFTKAEVDRDNIAAELVEALGRIVVAIDMWTQNTPPTRRLLASRLLADWQDKCGEASRRVIAIPATLKTNRDTRSFVISRMGSGQPMPFAARRRPGTTAPRPRTHPRSAQTRDITVVSILAGNMPKLGQGQLYTIAQVLEKEDRYTRDYVRKLASRYTATQERLNNSTPESD